MKRIFLPAIVSLSILSSCSSLKVNSYGKKAGTIQKGILLSTMIGKIRQPIFPIIDAAIFNEKTNAIASEIMALQQKNIDSCRIVVAQKLHQHFQCDLLFGEALQNMSAFNVLKDSLHFPEYLNTGNENYPVTINASGDVNPFKFSEGNVRQFFRDSTNYKSTISQIARITSSNFIAVSYSNLVVLGAGMFGIYGTLRLETYLYLFNANGDLLTDGYSASKITNISGKEIIDYQQQLNNLSYIIEPMVAKMALAIK